MLSCTGTVLETLSGQWSEALGNRTAPPSTVKIWPATLLWSPIAARALASASVSVPKAAWPSARGGAALGTTTSWIIQPSYQPDSLLITNRPDRSEKMSTNAPGSLGSVGRPGFGSSATRTEPIVGRSPLGPVAVGATPSLMPLTVWVNTFGWNPLVSSR